MNSLYTHSRRDLCHVFGFSLGTFRRMQQQHGEGFPAFEYDPKSNYRFYRLGEFTDFLQKNHPQWVRHAGNAEKSGDE